MLSGFLITHLLLDELGTRGHLDLGGFWLRRLRRLVPAILTLLLVCTSVALLIGGDALLSIRRQVLTALTFSYNWGEILFPGAHIDGWMNRTGAQAADLLREADENPEIRRRPYVVIGMAANATWQQSWLDALLAQVGEDRKLVLVNGFGPQSNGAIWASNDVIAAYATAHPTQVFVADWAASIAPHTDQLAQDFVHPTFDGGAHWFSVAVQDALARASRSW